MKKIVSMFLCMVMVLSLATVIVFPGSASDTTYKSYEDAADGDVLYKVNFKGDDGIYAPFNFRNGAAAMSATTISPSDDGYTVVAKAPNSTGAYFYGGKIGNLKVADGKKYTMTMQVKFPTGNAGVYFNFPNGLTKTEDYDPLKDMTYNYLYGIYGQVKAGACMAMSTAAGGKFTAELVSNGSVYTELPEGVAVDENGFVTVRIEIDGLFYSVFFNDKLYDQARLTPELVGVADDLGFSLYLYNKNAEVTIKDVVITKGCTYGAENSTYKYSALDYASFKDGDKILDVLFNQTTGAYKFGMIQEANEAKRTITVSDDGKTVTILDGDTDAAHWYGASFDGLKITDDTKYTFVYKLKDNDVNYAGCIAFNGCEFALNTLNRYNWYGRWSSLGSAAEGKRMKFAYNGTNFSGYNYTDANMAVFNTLVPALDENGYVDVAVELDGWKWNLYIADKNNENKLTLVQTVDVKTLGDEQSRPVLLGNSLSFMVYTYNKNIEFSVKDAVLYKGNIMSASATTPGDDTTTEKPADTTPAPGDDTTTEKPADTTPAPVDDTTTEKPAESTPAPVDGTTTDAPETEAPKKTGCGGISVVALAVVLVLGCAIIIKK